MTPLKRTLFALIFHVILGAQFAGGVQAQNIAPRVQEYMNALVKLHRFSGSVLIAKDGKALVSSGYGMANAEWAMPCEPDTKFRIGSITKQFTAMAIMILQQQGKLNVQDPICKYLEDCPNSWSSITIRNLLTHTSGIPSYTEFPEARERLLLPTTVTALIDTFKNKPLDFTPGEKFEYSNSGYVVLGYIIEKTSGVTYAEFLKEKIFEPLGMKDSGYDNTSIVLPHRAAGYNIKDGALINAEYSDMTEPYAAGALYSTVEDLLKWDQALYTTKLISSKSLEEMFTPFKASYGYGWGITTQFNRKLISHDGGINGFVSNIARFTDDRITIIVLSNLEAAPIRTISKDLAAIVFGEKYQLPQEHKFVNLDPATLDRYVGEYELMGGIVLTVAREGNKLTAKVQGASLDFYPESETTFFTKDFSYQMVFVTNEKATVTGVVFNRDFNGKKIK